MPATLFDKVWSGHVIRRLPDGRDLIHIDRHVLHEVTSPIAFEELELAGLTVRNPKLTVATIDHIVATTPGRTSASYAPGQAFIDALRRNTERHGITRFDLDGPDQGIVHVISPELGLALPGLTVVCGDSHTCTVGGLGALAFGIGSSEIKQVLATQCLALHRPAKLRATVSGKLGYGVTAKDVILALNGLIGARGGVGHAIEYAGSTIEAMSVEERLTVCNMSIELGSRIGLIAPDDAVFAYVEGRRFAPKGAAFDRAVAHWRELKTDADAAFDREVSLDASAISPRVTWGTSPDQEIEISGRIPNPSGIPDTRKRTAAEHALAYQGLRPGQPVKGIPIDRVFIGSCTNGRLSDLRAAAEVLKNRRVASGVRAIVVPGSIAVKRAAEAEGIDAIFRGAGAEWREPGCSMCCALQNDRLEPGSRCVSTSNRNFEGRQGPGGRTHLVSPPMAAAAAVTGRICDVRELGAVS